MATTIPAPITVDQYEHFAGYPGAKDELIYGRILMSPAPKANHQQIAENVQKILQQTVGPGYAVKQNTNVIFQGSHSAPAPDVFLVLREEWQRAVRAADYVRSVPELVVEVLSPGNRHVRRKLQLYLDHGVCDIWLVRPKTQSVLRYCRGEEMVALDTIDLLPPLQGHIPVRDIFDIGSD